jgi:hypothetical protein
MSIVKKIWSILTSLWGKEWEKGKPVIENILLNQLDKTKPILANYINSNKEQIIKILQEADGAVLAGQLVDNIKTYIDKQL